MKLPIMLVLGVSAILTHGNALADRPRHKRAVTPASSHAVLLQKSTAFAPQKTGTPLAPPAVPGNVADPEDVRYEQAKAKAKQDPEVKTLKAKADQATSEEDARRTSQAYNRTLFRKMRQIDRSVSERVDLVEVAILRKINE